MYRTRICAFVKILWNGRSLILITQVPFTDDLQAYHAAETITQFEQTPRLVLLITALVRSPSAWSHFFLLHLSPEARQTKHYSWPCFPISTAFKITLLFHLQLLLLTQLPCLCNKHRASIFKNTVKLCYNIPSQGSGQFVLWQTPPPHQDFLISGAQDASLALLQSPFSSFKTSHHSGICLPRSSWCVSQGEREKHSTASLPTRPSLETRVLMCLASSWGDLAGRTGGAGARDAAGSASGSAGTFSSTPRPQMRPRAPSEDTRAQDRGTNSPRASPDRSEGGGRAGCGPRGRQEEITRGRS